jgi:rod shape-determining protein MreC
MGRYAGRRTVIIVLVLASLTLITLDVRGSAPIDQARSYAADALSPVRSGANTVFRPFENTWNGVFSYDKIKKENERLRAQITAQEGAAQQAQAVIDEYEQLRALDGLSVIGNIPRVVAQVVGLPPSNFELTIEIDRGSKDGIKIGNPVVTGAGLVGRVTKVAASSSVVRLVTDPDLTFGAKLASVTPPATTTTVPPKTAVPTTTATTAALTPVAAAAAAAAATAAATSSTTVPPPTSAAPTTSTTVEIERGWCQGQGKDKALKVDLVDDDAPIKVNDVVVTSGVRESLFPPDIPVGRVSAVTRSAGSLQLGVDVTPVADLDHLNYVAVLLWKPAE